MLPNHQGHFAVKVRYKGKAVNLWIFHNPL